MFCCVAEDDAWCETTSRLTMGSLCNVGPPALGVDDRRVKPELAQRPSTGKGVLHIFWAHAQVLRGPRRQRSAGRPPRWTCGVPHPRPASPLQGIRSTHARGVQRAPDIGEATTPSSGWYWPMCAGKRCGKRSRRIASCGIRWTYITYRPSAAAEWRTRVGVCASRAMAGRLRS